MVPLRKEDVRRFLSWGRETVLGAEGREGKLGTPRELQDALCAAWPEGKGPELGAPNGAKHSYSIAPGRGGSGSASVREEGPLPIPLIWSGYCACQPQTLTLKVGRRGPANLFSVASLASCYLREHPQQQGAHLCRDRSARQGSPLIWGENLPGASLVLPNCFSLYLAPQWSTRLTSFLLFSRSVSCSRMGSPSVKPLTQVGAHFVRVLSRAGTLRTVLAPAAGMGRQWLSLHCSGSP